MRRAAVYAVAAVAGILVGAALALTVADEPTPAMVTLPSAAFAPVPPPSIVPGTTAPTLATAPTTTSAPTTTTTTAPPVATDEVLLVWTPGLLPAGFADAVAALPGVGSVSVVQGDQVGLAAWFHGDGRQAGQAPDGYQIPLEVGGFDAATYAEFVAPEVGAALAGLGPGEALLGETSARIRAIAAGGVLELADGTRLTVRGVVDDVAVGGMEVAVRQGEPAVVERKRYLLVRHEGDRTGLEAAITGLVPDGVAVRIRGPGETPVLRHGDAVLPQAQIKERFGEWAYRATGSGFEQDPAWVAEHIVEAEVPILGAVTCHRNLIPALTSALAELEQRNLAFLVDPDGFRGCWNPRFIAGRQDPSRHAWGAAVDLNFGANPTGRESAQDPRLLDVMERWGFTSGHDWLIPDPGHFEFLRPPRG